MRAPTSPRGEGNLPGTGGLTAHLHFLCVFPYTLQMDAPLSHINQVWGIVRLQRVLAKCYCSYLYQCDMRWELKITLSAFNPKLETPFLSLMNGVASIC